MLPQHALLTLCSAPWPVGRAFVSRPPLRQRSFEVLMHSRPPKAKQSLGQNFLQARTTTPRAPPSRSHALHRPSVPRDATPRAGR